MAARLIINADDFGLTPGINRAIAELHTAGALTSSTLMASGPAFDDAVTLSRSLPTLGVGCHIVLTDGSPVSDPTTLPSLCPNGRTFRSSLIEFIRDLLLHRIAPAEIQRESLAQFQKIERAGIRVTHFDSHKHTHLFPMVATQLTAIIRRCDFVALRNPFEPTFAHHIADTPIKRRLQIALLDRFRPAYERVTEGIRTTDGTIGISATGNLNATTLAAMLSAIPSGTFELVCHPGYNDTDLDAITTRLRSTRDIERLALLETFANSPTSSLPQLVNYTAL